MSSEYDRVFAFGENDKRLLARLEDFIPDKIFDAHCHSYLTQHAPSGDNLFKVFGEVGVERVLRDKCTIYGNRKFGALLLPSPITDFNAFPERQRDMNEWMNREVDGQSAFVGALTVSPGNTYDEIKKMITSSNIRAINANFNSSNITPVKNLAHPSEYLTEDMLAAANDLGLAISIHMSKPEALSDKDNSAYFKSAAQRYPDAKLVLTHGARGFASWTLIESIKEFANITNIYFDLAAVCDIAVIHEIIRYACVERVMWGTDYFVDRMHCRAQNCADGFTWTYAHELPENMTFPCAMLHLESMFALYQASLMLGLSRADVEKIFAGTACELFGLEY